jgi:glutathione S-transferase
MNPLQRTLDVSRSMLASQLRGWRGTTTFEPAARQPERPLELYEFEACPYCRLVREALTELDLDALIFPCPKGGRRFRPRAEAAGGKRQFPLLVDPTAGRTLYESADIIAHLVGTYGGRLRGPLLPQLPQVAASTLASLSQVMRGARARPSVAPEKPLELYSFEASPYSRLVREVLTELELPYLLRSTGKARWEDMGPPWVRKTFFPTTPVAGRNRTRLLERTGRVQVPYLIDPNTGVEMFESADIRAYLERTYAA